MTPTLFTQSFRGRRRRRLRKVENIAAAIHALYRQFMNDRCKGEKILK